MNPKDIVDSMREYTSSNYKVNMEDVIVVHGLIEDLLGFLLGLMVGFIVSGIVLITALDICYITLPPFRIVVREHKYNGKELFKFRLISKNAINAVEVGDVNGTHPLHLYIMGRLKTYAICAVVLYIIIVGSDTIIPFMGKIVSSIVMAFKNIHIIP